MFHKGFLEFSGTHLIRKLLILKFFELLSSTGFFLKMRVCVYSCACVVCFVNLTQARVVLEEGTEDEKMPPPDRPVGKSSLVHSPD